VLVVPCILLIFSLLFHKLPKKLSPNYKLVGVTVQNERPKFNLKNFRNHEIQKFIEGKVAESLPLRSQFLRLNNQLYFTLFKKSYSYSGAIVIGNNNQLIEQVYLSTYCHREPAPIDNDEKANDWAIKLSTLHHYYQRKGKTFIYLITPSKPESMPEIIPKRYHCPKRSIEEHLGKFTHLLDEYKVPYINGPALIMAGAKKYNTPMFPQGGTHWNQLGATLACNKLIDRINNERTSEIPALSFTYHMTKKIGGGNSDSDLFNLLNLLRRHSNYYVPELDFTQDKKSEYTDKKLCFVGGSFCEKLIDILCENKVFSDIQYYRYLKLDRRAYHNGQWTGTVDDVDTNKVISQINSNDIIILEENSERVISNHGTLFYDLLAKAEKLDKIN
jgi:hypothetical protein